MGTFPAGGRAAIKAPFVWTTAAAELGSAELLQADDGVPPTPPPIIREKSEEGEVALAKSDKALLCGSATNPKRWSCRVKDSTSKVSSALLSLCVAGSRVQRSRPSTVHSASNPHATRPHVPPFQWHMALSPDTNTPPPKPLPLPPPLPLAPLRAPTPKKSSSAASSPPAKGSSGDEGSVDSSPSSANKADKEVEDVADDDDWDMSPQS
mmetsp:Transcript_61544/g.120854  ORF Transcript_61544/g.120854 Transcript_61544/m.120854 type:complete len:209 (-) Transcript_61544:2540-3166(-)